MTTNRQAPNGPVFLAAVAMSLMSALVSAETHDSIGSSKIRLPEVAGFTRLTAQMQPKNHVAADLVTQCDSFTCAMYVTDDVFDRPDPAGIDDIRLASSLFYSVQLLDESVSMDAENFARFKAAMSQGKNSLRMILSQAMLQTYSESNVGELGQQPAMLGPPTVAVSDEIVENGFSSRMFATGLMTHMMPDGKTREYSMAVVFGCIFVRKKLLIATIFGNEDELPRAQRLFDEVALATARMNEQE